MFEKILFPIDFSEQSIMMVDCVVELKNFGAEEVLFLHVLPKGAVLTGEQGKVVKEIMQKVESNGLKARFEKIEGDPVTAIAETAEKEEATAVVMASSGKGRAREFLVGSTSFGVLRKTAKPVLIDKFLVTEKDGQRKVKPACTLLFRTALVPLDFSVCTAGVIDMLHHLSKRGLNKIILMHVIESAKYSVASDKRFGTVKKRLDDLRKDLAGVGFDVSVHIHFGTPAYNILEVAREVDASLIILGASGKSFLRGLTLGSVSEEVIRRATVPLLVVRC